MTTNLLKRLESSVHSFRLTLKTVLESIEQTLGVIERFTLQQAHSRQVAEPGMAYESPTMPENNFDPDDDLSVGKKIRIDLSDMDVIGWRQKLFEDQQVLQGLLAEMAQISPEHDSKLQHIKQVIIDKVQWPLNENNKKDPNFHRFFRYGRVFV